MVPVARAWRLELGIADLAAARFAVSPVYETGQALAVLRSGTVPSALHAWVRQSTTRRLDSYLRTPLLDELVFHGGPSYPEFLTPSPSSMRTSIDDELDTVARTPAEAVRASVRRVWPARSEPHAARMLVRDTGATLRGVVDELRQAHTLLVRPHWPRLQSLMQADVAHKARRIAGGGYGAILASLDPSARWDGAALRVGGSAGRTVRLSPGGLILAPTVFGSASLNAKHASSTQTVLRYPARGAGNAFAAQTTATGALVRLVGRSRAEALALLTSPATPTELASSLQVTPSAVVQTLRVLKDAGLVRSDRFGRRAVYSMTDVGAALVNGTALESGLSSSRAGD